VRNEREPAIAQERGGGEASQARGELPLFGSPSTLARASDPATSKQAIDGILGCLSALQQRVLSAFRVPLTTNQADRLVEFADLAFSTVRRRISELHRGGLLADTGRTEAACTVYEALA
jgi:hypothetical protein